MARSKEEKRFIVQGGDSFLEMMRKIRASWGRHELTEEDFYLLGTPEGDPIIEAMVEAAVSRLGLPSYAITVNYKLTVEQMVVALGCDGYVNTNIDTQNFGEEVAAKKDAKEYLNVVLFHLGREATSQEVRDEMEKRGLRPATLAELLAFGAQHPEKQREFPIAALGSDCVLYGGRRVAYLWGDASKRDLFLYCLGGGWRAAWRFLAVRK